VSYVHTGRSPGPATILSRQRGGKEEKKKGKEKTPQDVCLVHEDTIAVIPSNQPAAEGQKGEIKKKGGEKGKRKLCSLRLVATSGASRFSVKWGEMREKEKGEKRVPTVFAY